MEATRHVVRRNPSIPGQLPGAVELPSYGDDELGDFQASVPMPERAGRPAGGDREPTEALGDARSGRSVLAPARKPLERTQPISLACGGGAASDRLRSEPYESLRIEIAAALPQAKPRRRVSAQPAAGDVFCGRYVIVEKVDHYGMGLVYKARDRQRERAGSPMPWVALKFARPGSGTAPETRRLLRQEFLKLSQLNHPNVVKVYDLASDAGTEFIVMEWLSGETLAGLLARISARRLALEKAVEIVRCTARGLAHAHDLGIVHGDVKPSNIFLANNRAVKLLDFGSSGTTSTDEADRERNWATRAYASPQVLEGEAPQPHDDVFALGVTAWCLLSGDRPFGDRDALAARAEGVEPPPLPPDAHEQWPAVRHALAFEAIDRPQHAKLFVRELDERRGEIAGTPSHGAPAVTYGAVVATLLAAVVWLSVQGVGSRGHDAGAELDRAEAALAAGRVDESARSWYQAALDADPGNPYALAGLATIAEGYIVRARAHVADGNAAAARADLDRAREVSPEHIAIPIVEDLILRQGRDFLLRARHAAATDSSEAEALLARAEGLLPPDDPELAGVREELARQRASVRVDALLREIDDRILSERLTVPRGDSALDLLRQARELSPGDRKIALAADRIMTALLFQAMFAISNGSLADAEKYLEMARGMGLEHLALARAEYELAKARRAAVSAP